MQLPFPVAANPPSSPQLQNHTNHRSDFQTRLPIRPHDLGHPIRVRIGKNTVQRPRKIVPVKEGINPHEPRKVITEKGHRTLLTESSYRFDSLRRTNTRSSSLVDRHSVFEGRGRHQHLLTAQPSHILNFPVKVTPNREHTS